MAHRFLQHDISRRSGFSVHLFSGTDYSCLYERSHGDLFRSRLPSYHLLRQSRLCLRDSDGAIVQWRRRHVNTDCRQPLRILAVSNSSDLLPRITDISRTARDVLRNSYCGNCNRNCGRCALPARTMEEEADLKWVSLPIYGEECPKEKVVRSFQRIERKVARPHAIRYRLHHCRQKEAD